MQIDEGNAHASGLHVLVEQLLSKADLKPDQIDAVAVSKGPGSYTGLRVGVSAAKGYCYSLEIPLIAIDSLTSLASHFLISSEIAKDALLVPMIDARRMEVYTSVFNCDLQTIKPISAAIIDEHAYLDLLLTKQLFFFGNGSQKCKAVITHRNAFFIDNIHCSADGLASLAHTKFLAGDFEDVAYFEPYYLKDFIGTQVKKI